jgi:serine protease inhibitor
LWYITSVTKISDKLKSLTDYESVEHIASINAELNKKSNENFKDTDVVSVNSIWHVDSIKLNKEYSDEMSKIGHIYISTRGKLQSAINAWISDKTQKVIQSMIISPSTDIAIINALYFKGRWIEPFEKALTKEKSFHISENKTCQKQFMIMNDTMCFVYETAEQIILRKDFENNYMFVIVMNKSGYTVPKISANELTDYIKKSGYRDVKLIEIPKIDIETEHDLKEIMRPHFANMYLTKPFTPNNKISKSSDNEVTFGFYDKISTVSQDLDQIKQKVKITVDEEGAKAAAATMVGFASCAPPSKVPPIIFKANRPFAFNIVKRICTKTGFEYVIMFSGAIVN